MKIVDVEEFARSAQYLGLGGAVWPGVMDDLWQIFHGEHSDEIIEVVLGGGIGCGKTHSAQIGLAYQTYLLSTYHCPQLEFGLAPGTPIDLVIQSVDLSKARKVGFEALRTWMTKSPYFAKNFPPVEGLVNVLRMPNSITILPVSSSDTAALGMNVWGGLVDEISFMQRTANSSRARFTGEAEYDQAVKIYTTIIRRMQSRFNKCGRVPGKLFLAASANYPGDFVDRKVKEAASDIAAGRRYTTFVTIRREWEVKPRGAFSEEMFLVEVGDEVRQSRIIQSMEDAVDPDAVIPVPVDFQDSFEKDLEAAIRDICGVAVAGTNTFIKQREKLAACFQKHVEYYDGRQLFAPDSVELSKYDGRVGDLLNEEFLEELRQSGHQFVAHVDLALRRDSCGIAVSHVPGYQFVGKTTNWDQTEKRYVEVAAGEQPVFVVDGVLEVVPPLVDEIDLTLVGDLLTALATRLNLVGVTADSFESTALLQRMRKTVNAFGKKIKAAVVSVDAELTGYATVRQAIRDDRLLMPRIEKLHRELRELQIDPKKAKVDHPPTGSKDLADAVAGTLHVLGNLHRSRGKLQAATTATDETTGRVSVIRQESSSRRRSRRRLL